MYWLPDSNSSAPVTIFGAFFSLRSPAWLFDPFWFQKSTRGIRHASHDLQFGHFEKVTPGKIPRFFARRDFFAGLGISFRVMTFENGVIICSEPHVRSKGSEMDPPTY